MTIESIIYTKSHHTDQSEVSRLQPDKYVEKA